MTGVNLFQRYETDQAKEKNGATITIDGAEFYCRRAGGSNRSYRIVLGRLMEAQRENLLKDVASDEAQTAEFEVVLQAFADCVVIGWNNVLDRDGNPWEFSKENFKDLMRSCPDVWDHIRVEVHNFDNFRRETVKQAADFVGNE